MSKYSSEMDYIRHGKRLYQVNARSNQPIFTHQVKNIIVQVEAMASWHSRVLIFVFNLHQPKGTVDNQTMVLFITKMRYILKRDYNITRFGYSWCREQEKANSQHYHVGFMLDGSKINYPNKLLNIAKSVWKRLTNGGHLHTPENCYYFMHRSDEDTKSKAIYRLSYQAKVRSKDPSNRKEGVNDYGMSRIKMKPPIT